MSPHSPILLIFGAGPNIGAGVAKAFALKGYQIALSSRSAKASEDTKDRIHIAADLTDPSSVARVFAAVKERFGVPSVVVYNAGARTSVPPTDPLTIPLEAFTNDLAINTTSMYAAALASVSGFSTLPNSEASTFIFTGNILNTGTIMLGLFDQAVGKVATAKIVEQAALAYKDRGYKFYYADERKADGTAIFKVHGDAHGKEYVELAEGRAQGEWLHTFVMGVGYVKF